MQPAHLSEPVFARLANSVWAFGQDYWRLVVVAMLAALHVAVFRGVADPWARALLLVLAPSPEISPEIRSAAEYLLPLAFVLILALPAEPEPADTAQVIDFFYSMFLMLLLVVVILGSFTFMTLRRTGYLEALTYTVFLTAGAVLLVGLAWNPRSGFAGLNVFFVRSLFSIGLPVEQWLHFLAELLQREARPERFLVEALSGLARLPSVSGVSWKAAEASGEKGERTAHAVDFENGAVSLRIYSRYRLSPALLWHLHLLGQLLGEFYMAKLREEQLRQASYVQAVHETGARMTHDIKNLLQSLNVLCSVAARDHDRDSAELQALIRRQLPLITQRLSETLAKLQRPNAAGETYVPAQAWWDALGRQYRGEGVELEAGAFSPRGRLPRAPFHRVARNPIRNAPPKRSAERGTRGRGSLVCEGGIALRVRDSGRAVPPELESELMCAPRVSAGGLGNGLYHAGRHAGSDAYQ